jgi:hypothetical protein
MVGAQHDSHNKKDNMIRLKQLILELTNKPWDSCVNWDSNKENLIKPIILSPEFMPGPAIAIETNSANFTATYQGPASGVHVAHAKGLNGDTLHQLFNVVACELNTYLADKKLKPDLPGITTECTKSETVKGVYTLIIHVPLTESKTAWQINHRGGWGHDPGKNAVIKAAPSWLDPEDVYTETTIIPSGGKITTHFATYTLNKP